MLQQPWSFWLSIVTLLLLAFGLRVWGVDFGRPLTGFYPAYESTGMLHAQASVHPDEYVMAATPVNMVLWDRWNPRFFEYPSLTLLSNAALYRLTGATTGMALSDRRNRSVRVYAPYPLFVFTRVLYSVMGGMLATAGALAAGRILGGPFAGWVAGWLVALSPLMVQYGHYAKPEAFAVGWMALVTWTSLRALRSGHDRGRIAWLLLSAVLTGMAATTRYNAAVIGGVMGLTGLILIVRYRRTMMGAFAVSLMLVPVVFFAGTPHAIRDFELFWEQFSYITGQFLVTGANVAQHFLVSPETGLYVLARHLVLFGVGLTGALLVPLALWALWRGWVRGRVWYRQPTRNLGLIVLGVTILVYVFLNFRIVRPGHSDNLVMLIVPQLALWVGVGAAWLAHWVPRPLVLAFVLIVPALMSVPVLRVFTQMDTREQMAQWIREHLPPESYIFLNGPYNVALDETLYNIEERFAGYTSPVAMTPLVDYVVFSDAMVFDVLRAGEIVPESVVQDWLNFQWTHDMAFTRVHHIPRPVWPGHDWMLNNIAYWHNPALTVYCTSEAACEALGVRRFNGPVIE